MTINWIAGTAVLGTATTDASIPSGTIATVNCTALATNQSVRNVTIRVVNGATPPTIRAPISVQVSNDNQNFATILPRTGPVGANAVLEFPFSTEHWQHVRILIDNTGGGGNAISGRIIQGRKDIVPGA